ASLRLFARTHGRHFPLRNRTRPDVLRQRLHRQREVLAVRPDLRARIFCRPHRDRASLVAGDPLSPSGTASIGSCPFYQGWPGAAGGTMPSSRRPVRSGATLAGAGDPSIVVKYPQGEKRIVIPANAHVVRNTFGNKDDLKAGAVFRANAATKQTDGS